MSKVAHSQPGRDEPGSNVDSLRCSLRNDVGQSPDLVDDRRPELAGQIMAHAGKTDQPGAGNCRRGRDAGDQLDQRIGLAMDDQGRRAYLRQLFAPVSGGRDGRRMPLVNELRCDSSRKSSAIARRSKKRGLCMMEM